MDFTVDRNPYKHGRYTPGTHIPIYPVEAIDEAKPDYILIRDYRVCFGSSQNMATANAALIKRGRLLARTKSRLIEIPREKRSGVPFTEEQLTAYAALR